MTAPENQTPPPGSATPAGPAPLVVVRLLLASVVIGVVVSLGFEAFETASHHVRDLLWIDWAGEDPSALATILLATVGGLALGLTLRFVPGHGGVHPADSHTLIPDVEGRVVLVLSTLAVGFVSLVAGASLGPEGAVIPAAAGVSLVVAALVKVPAPLNRLLPGVGVSALLAAMFGSPLAGTVPLLEMAAGSTVAFPIVMVVLPALTASATAAMTLQVIHAEPAGFLPLGYETFHGGDLFWAVVLGVVCGAAGLFVSRLVPLLRTITRRIDAIDIVVTTTVGGLVLGVLYAIGGTEVRFAGIPELLHLVAREPSTLSSLLDVGIKVAATAWCLAVGYRGGKIFPIAFIGGAVGLTLHTLVDRVPLSVAIGCGLAAALATGLGTPITAALVAASVLGPALLPAAIVSVVVAHTVYLLAAQLAPSLADPTAPAAT